MKKIILVSMILMGFIFTAFAQENEIYTTNTKVIQKDNRQSGEEVDYNYQKLEKRERKVPPYPPLREADVIYVKRIERVIDTREKKNNVMTWPQNPLNRIIYNLVTTGESGETGKLRAYKTDSLTNALTVEQVSKIGGMIDIIQVRNDTSANGDIYDTHEEKVVTPFDYTQIKRWQITEEWIFDKQRSMFFPRIIAVAPLYQPSLNGVLLSEQPMFYVNYKDLRPILANEEVFNRQNDAMRLSYYDFFEERLFSSYITKVSNDKDFAIKEYPEFKDAPLDALFESERAKNEIANWEQDLWEY